MKNEAPLRHRISILSTLPFAERRAFNMGLCLRKRNPGVVGRDRADFESAIKAGGLSDKDLQKNDHGHYKETAVESAWSGWSGDFLTESDLLEAIQSLNGEYLPNLKSHDWCVVNFFVSHGRLFDVWIFMGTDPSDLALDANTLRSLNQSSNELRMQPNLQVFFGPQPPTVAIPAAVPVSDAVVLPKPPTLSEMKTEHCSTAQLQAAIVHLIGLHNQMSEQVNKRLPTRLDVMHSSRYGL
jgi:hypothetical protein